jgi:hypothetical protein
MASALTAVFKKTGSLRDSIDAGLAQEQQQGGHYGADAGHQAVNGEDNGIREEGEEEGEGQDGGSRSLELQVCPATCNAYLGQLSKCMATTDICSHSSATWAKHV